MQALLAVVGLAAAAFAVYEFFEYTKHNTESAGFTHIVLALVGIGVFCVCAFVIFYKKFHSDADQDISITKF
ncbi:MAG: hypothetical protein IT175_16585 [Acidobacteria bacterium]|nr:hypothetical protein [Acidobacteriota bacterium]